MNISQHFLNQNFGRISKAKIKKVDSNLVVKYTRVSGGKQLETDSLENQEKAVNEYAIRHGLQIVASFGHTHESAKTDDRKEFQRMIDFCRRSNGKISTILVYKMTRFSRSGGKAITIAEDLRNKYGIHIISVSEQVDTSNSTGVVMQEMQLVFAKWDNAQRKEITQSGMKSKYEKGEWLTQLPPGYDVIKHNKERKIVINAEGRKIQKAWQWKLQGMRNEDISHKLAKMGLFMYPQKIHKIFKNPFYCGLIAHGILDGKVVEGKHEAMVSKEDFFKINQIRLDSTRCGISHKKENEFMPMKIFVRCSACNEGMTGYIVKKKNLYYYKCRKEGCNCNKSAKNMHKQLLEKLVQYSAKEKLSTALACKYETAYQEKNKENIKQKAEFEKRLTEIKDSIEKLDDKFYIREEMNKEKYDSLSAKLEKERLQISEELAKLGQMSSNLAEKMVQASELSRKLTEIWASGSFDIKTRLQKLVFPEGMGYDKKTDSLLTPKINEALFEIARIAGDSAIMKEGFNVTQNKKSPFAETEGFEPSIHLRVYKLSRLARSTTLTSLLL